MKQQVLEVLVQLRDYAKELHPSKDGRKLIATKTLILKMEEWLET